ncbi:MAG TPA: hypothetical protein VJG30_02935 [Candidatus Nanoarchaeia archaeon]|nr:hypothetical protein [Candidatus Nanoarchaeia archaeon]
MYEYIISFLGLPTGYVIAKYTEEELKKGKIYFQLIEIITLIAIVGILLNNFQAIPYALGLVIGYFFRYEYFYLGLGAVNNLENSLRFLHSSLIFLYGLAYGSINYKNINLVLFNLLFFLMPFLLILLEYYVTSLAAGALTSTLILKAYKLIE